METFECMNCGEVLPVVTDEALDAYHEEHATIDKTELLWEDDFCIECAADADMEDEDLILLALHLSEPVEDVTRSTYDEHLFEAAGGEWLVLSYEDAKIRAEEYAVNLARDTSEVPGFLEHYIDWDRFASDAVSADGLGFWLSSYDGNEDEIGGYLGGRRWDYHVFRVN